jgi:PAS domain S-box-containing protein
MITIFFTDKLTFNLLRLDSDASVDTLHYLHFDELEFSDSLLALSEEFIAVIDVKFLSTFKDYSSKRSNYTSILLLADDDQHDMDLKVYQTFDIVLPKKANLSWITTLYLVINQVQVSQLKLQNQRLSQLTKCEITPVIAEAPISVYRLNKDFMVLNSNVVFPNPYEIPELKGQSFFELVGEENREFILHSIAELSESKPVSVFEIKYTSPTNQIFVFQIQWAKCNFPIPHSYTVICHDITSQMQAAKRIQSSERRFRTFYDNNLNGVFFVDNQMIVKSVNTKFIELMSPKINFHFINLPLTEVFKNFEGVSNYLKQPLKIDTINRFECFGTNFEGQPLYCLFSLQKLDENEWLGVVYDMTEEHDVALENKLLRKSVDSIVSMVVITDRTGKVQYINKRFKEITGYTFFEVKGKNPRVLKSGNTPASVYENLWITILSGKNWTGEWQNKAKDGSLYWETVRISPVHDLSGNITHFIAIKEDITKEKEAQKKMNLVQEKAHEVELFQSELLATIAHEIRNAMNTILGFTDLLSQTNVNNDKVLLYSNFIYGSAKNLLLTFDHLMEISLFELQLKEVKFETIHVNDFLTKIYKSSCLKFSKINRSLLFQKTDFSTVSIKTDVTVLEKTIQILLDNAFILSTNQQIEIGMILRNHQVIIYMKDTANSLDFSIQSKLLNESTSDDNTISSKLSGIGLVMNIAKRNVNLIGGSIETESKPDGDCISLVFPILDQQIESNVKESNELTAKTKTILVAEDELINYKLLEILLKHIDRNFSVLHAFNGKEAVKKLKENPDMSVVFMDIKMPVMDGLEAMQQIRTFNTDIPIIAQTAFTADEDKLIAFKSGANDFISKPINKEELKAIIQKYL